MSARGGRGRAAAQRGAQRTRAHLWPDEDDAARLELGDKGRVLAEEAVARVHGLRARGGHGRQHARHAQIALGRARGPQQHRLVRRGHVDARKIGLAVHGHRLDACAGKQVAARAWQDDARRTHARPRARAFGAAGGARTEPVRRAAYAARNFAAVGDEDLVEQRLRRAARATHGAGAWRGVRAAEQRAHHDRQGERAAAKTGLR